MNSVEFIGHYGSDLTHAQAAWTSTHRDLSDEKLGRVGKLLQMLAREGHHTPFEKSMQHFLIRCDDASHIHALKHRIGVSVNGESARYKELQEPTAHIPEDWPQEWRDALAYAHKQAVADYHQCLRELEPILGRKRAKESARFFLPKCNQLTLDVNFNWRSLMHCAGLREHGQLEIRDIIRCILNAVVGLYPESAKAFGVTVNDDHPTCELRTA